MIIYKVTNLINNKAYIGKPLSEEHKRKLAVAVRPPNTWSKGTHRPEDIKNRISESMKKVWKDRRENVVE